MIIETPLRSTVRLLVFFAGLPGMMLGQVPADTTAPQITAFGFSPASINTTAAPAGITVSLAAKDDQSGVAYVEISFADPTGNPIQRLSVPLAPALNVSTSRVLTFPRFSTPGTWTVNTIFVADAAGNTTILGTNDAAAAGFPTALTVVSSASDSTPPNLTALTLTSDTIDTTNGPAPVGFNFSTTDDLAGCSAVQINLLSPSSVGRTTTVSLMPATSVSGSANFIFPKLSEGGTWNVASVFLSDAAGNTQTLDTAALTSKGFPTSLTVLSRQDTTAPTLTGLTFPTTVNIAAADASVPLSFQVTDDISGATTFQAAFASPSGAVTLGGGADFAASTSASGVAVIRIPKGSETGTWTLTTAFLADAAGNTKVMSTGDLAGRFPTQLSVVVTDTTPPVIVPTVAPAPGITGWNNSAPVNVTWSVTDPESGIASATGCGATSITTETPGTVLTCTATNGAGLSASASVTVKLDETPPVITGLPTPSTCVLWPPNGKLVQVATVMARDALSGLAPGSLIVTGTSSEPQDPKNPDVVISQNSSGAYVVQLRADRLATGNGRTYTLTGRATDVAGNVATITTTCTVPHDQGH